jgi:drug/metabolite transporter (DMT)-like permease
MNSRFIFIILSLIWGSSFMLIKYVVLCFGPVSTGALRLVLGAMFLGAVWMVRRQYQHVPPNKWPHLVVLSLTGYGLPFCILPWLIAETGNSGLMGMMIVFVPLFTIVVSIPVLGIRPSRRELAGVMGGLIAMIMIRIDTSARQIPLMYILLAFLVPMLYAYSTAVLRKWFPNSDQLPVAMKSMIISAVVLLPIAWMTEPVRMDQNFSLALISLVGLGTLATGLAVYFFYILIQRHGPLQAGMIAYVAPNIILTWSWVLKEEVTILQVMSMLIVLAMVWLVRSGRQTLKES